MPIFRRAFGQPIVPICIAAIVLRIALVWVPGFPGDVAVFKTWASVLAEHGPRAIYAPGVTPAVDYPPAFLYVLWFDGIVDRALGGGDIVWRVVLKTIPIGADVAAIVLVYALAQRAYGERRAAIAAAIAAFAPTLWLDSAYWGQCDSIPIALMLAALLWMLERRVAWAIVACSLAFAVKPLALALAPVLAVVAIRERVSAAGAALGVALSVAIAYVLAAPFSPAPGPVPTFGFLLERYAGGAAKAPHTSEGAFSFFALTGGFFASDLQRFGPWPYVDWGIALVAAGSIASVVLLWRSYDAGDEQRRTAHSLLAASASSLALFVFATRMHERYLLPALILGAPLVFESAAPAAAICWLTVAFALNCALLLGGFSGGTHHPFLATAGRGIAAGNVVAFALLIWSGMRQPMSSRAPR